MAASDPSPKEIRKHVKYDPLAGVFSRVLQNGKIRVYDFSKRKSRPTIFCGHVEGHDGRIRATRAAWMYVTGKKIPDGYNVAPKDLNHCNLKFDNLECLPWTEIREMDNIRKDNTTGRRGVYMWGNRFRGIIAKDKIKHASPIFNTMEEAVKWREMMEQRLYTRTPRERQTE